MPKTIQLTLNNSGSDPGPYNIFLVDSGGNSTQWSTVVTKQQLISGYTFTVPDNIVKVNVKSKSTNNCDASEDLTIPTTQCPCRRIKFKGGTTVTTFTFYQCGSTTPTTLNISNVEIIRCVDTYQPITKVGAGVFQDTLECCTSTPGSSTTTSTTIRPTTTTTTVRPSTTTTTTIRPTTTTTIRPTTTTTIRPTSTTTTTIRPTTTTTIRPTTTTTTRRPTTTTTIRPTTTTTTVRPTTTTTTQLQPGARFEITTQTDCNNAVDPPTTNDGLIRSWAPFTQVSNTIPNLQLITENLTGSVGQGTAYGIKNTGTSSLTFNVNLNVPLQINWTGYQSIASEVFRIGLVKISNSLLPYLASETVIAQIFETANGFSEVINTTLTYNGSVTLAANEILLVRVWCTARNFAPGEGPDGVIPTGTGCIDWTPNNQLGGFLKIN